jgi:hypothetical protein
LGKRCAIPVTWAALAALFAACSTVSSSLAPLASEAPLPSLYTCPAEDFGEGRFEFDGTEVSIVLADGTYRVTHLGPYRVAPDEPPRLIDADGREVAREGQLRSVFGTFGRSGAVGICTVLPPNA